MMVIIIGQNRAERCKISVKDMEKHFFETRGQLYRVYPNGLTRMRVYVDGEEKDSDEVLIFRENAIIPYHPRGLDYSPDRILAEIDEHKLMSPRLMFGRMQLIMKQASGAYKTLAPMAGTIIAVVVVGWALLTG